METKIISGYGKTSVFNFLSHAIYKYRCQWIKTIAGHRYMSGTMTIAAPSMDIAIEKASAIRGYKPSLIQRI